MRAQSSNIHCLQRGLLHGATAVLASCIQLVEKRIHPEPGNSGLPATCVFVKAMLHWFQWIVSESGLAGAATPGDARLVSGAEGWGRGPEIQDPGLGPASRGLLLAQAMALEPERSLRGELLSACIPATVALAAVLSGCTGAGGASFSSADHCENDLPDSNNDGTRSVGKQASLTRCMWVPLSLPGGQDNRMRDPAPAAQVAFVQPGSRQALEIAAAHLRQALALVTVKDRPINIRAAEEAADVGEVTVLWRAVCLSRAVESRLGSSSAAPGVLKLGSEVGAWSGPLPRDNNNIS